VRKDNFIAVRTDFWDIGGQPLKTVTASEIKAVGTNSKWQRMVSEAVNLQNGRKTVIQAWAPAKTEQRGRPLAYSDGSAVIVFLKRRLWQNTLPVQDFGPIKLYPLPVPGLETDLFA
jgi:hypothetical protein